MKILVSQKVAQSGLNILSEEHEVDTYSDLTEEQLKKMVPQYHALVVSGDTKVTKEIIDSGINLKVIGRAGSGVEHIDIPAATKKGIIVLNAPKGNSAASIEYTMGMLLALSRKIPQAYNSVLKSQWKRNEYTGVELREKKLGVIGLGRAGAGVAKRAKAFEMKVLAYDPFISEEKAKELDIQLTELNDLLEKSDYITLHLPKTVDTRNLLDKKAFSRMKKGVRIINCARGGIIDEAALLEAIESGIVAGAALDSFEEEPLPDAHPFLKYENVICTPNISSRTDEAQNEVAVGVAKGVLAALRSEPVISSLNIPPVSKKVMETIKPYLDLVEKMGVLAIHLAEGRVKNLEVRYNGSISEVDSKMLTLAVIKGILNPILQEGVNYVNAPEVAKSRGIIVKEIKSKEADLFVDLITVSVRTDKAEYKVAGTLFGKKQGRIVMIDDIRVDIDPQGWLLLIPHDDHPGMVGKVGTFLGKNKINITSMQVGKTEFEGTNIMVVGVESEIHCDVISKMKELEGIHGIKKINFDLE